MIRASRRQALAGAVAAPLVAASPRRSSVGPTVTVYDPALASPPAAGARPIAGDRIRFARALFGQRPVWVVGLSRRADALLIEDVGRESGYVPVAAPAGLGAHGWALAPRS